MLMEILHPVDLRYNYQSTYSGDMFFTINQLWIDYEIM